MKLWNSLTQKKETFKPTADEVGLYSCGPTVYSRAHIGNLRAYVFTDVLHRVLQLNGFQVKHVMNITDVGHLTDDADSGEDKMEKAAKAERKTAPEIAKEYEGWFKKDAGDLNILPPTIYARVTDYIKEQIALIQEIEKKKLTYKTQDGIYFNTGKFKGYGAFKQVDLEGLQEGARVKKTKGKKNPTDFALWKFSPKNKQRDMEWDSPWGKGFPGWHIECSAISAKLLDIPFDIHTGGVDHIPVHHMNEIAQTKAATGKDMARIWMHNEHLRMGTEKMAKSEGNVVTLDTLRENGIEPAAFRYYLLNTHYRQAIDYSEEGLSAAKTAYTKLLRKLEKLDPPSDAGCSEFEQQFKEAVNDDLNTSKGLAVMWDMLKYDCASGDVHKSLLYMDDILGLGLGDHEKQEADVPAHIRELMSERQSAREEMNFTSADLVRERIEAEGWVVEDSEDGQSVRKK